MPQQPNETLREYVMKRSAALKAERSSFDAQWKDLAQFNQPRLSRFFISDSNRGDKRWNHIVNNQGTRSLRSATAGMLAGVMSPTRRWMKFETPDEDLMKVPAVAQWLYKFETLLFTIFSNSNLYTMAPMALKEILLFGTASMSHVDDYSDVMRFYHHTIGSYSLAQNDRYTIDTMAREYQATVRQLVEKYGKAVSRTTKNLYDKGTYEAWVPCGHFVEPNENADTGKLDSKFKAFKSIYFELGATNPGDTVLSEKGFDWFPAHTPRWDVTGEDVYATDCPGMSTLGDVKGLQVLERRMAQAIEKMVAPPLKGPPSLKNVQLRNMPGGLTIYDPGSGGAQDGLSPIYTVNPHVQELLMNQEKHEERIKSGYYEDLFRSIDSMEGVQPQNQLFLSMKNAEKLLQLGPVLERLHTEFLNPIVDRGFNQILAAGLMPPPPPELQGQALKVKYISTLAQAQREVATSAIDKLTMFISGLMQMGLTNAGDKFDVDKAISNYAYALGAPPDVLVPDEVAQAARQQRAQMAKVQQGVETAATGAQAAQALANSPMPNGTDPNANALTTAVAGLQANRPPGR